MAQLRAFMLPRRARPPTRRMLYEDDCDGGSTGQAAVLRWRASRAQLGPYNVWETNGALGNAHDAGQGVVRVLPRSADRRRGSPFDAERDQPGRQLHPPQRADRRSTRPTRPLWQFWDGRADSLWSQALSPPEGPAECSGTRLGVAHVLYDHYRAAFEEVFGPDALPDDLARHHAGSRPRESRASRRLPAGDRTSRSPTSSTAWPNRPTGR